MSRAHVEHTQNMSITGSFAVSRIQIPDFPLGESTTRMLKDTEQLMPFLHNLDPGWFFSGRSRRDVQEGVNKSRF